MSVYDRWHRSPLAGDEPCRCGTARRPLYPSADHRQGDRWQVRWRDENGKQCKKNFAKKEGKDPERHADAFDAANSKSIDDGTYVDPKTAETTFREFAEEWRKNRTHDETTKIKVEYYFRLHVHPDPATPGRTPGGGPALGSHKLRELARRPSLVQQWISGMRLADSSKLLVADWVSSVFGAAIDDGLIARNPLRAKSVSLPKPERHEAVPLTPRQVEALAEALRHERRCPPDCTACGPSRYGIIPWLGAGTGMRQGEMFALDARTDIDFLRRVIHVRREVKIIGTALLFAPLKNDKIHDVPVTEDLCSRLARYMQLFPPEQVTLPWKTADPAAKGYRLASFTLLLTRPGPRAMHRQIANDNWHVALDRAGIDNDRYHMMHVLRHTAVSAWLSEGMSTRAVAEFIGDTEATVTKTYSHLMPDDRDKARRAMDRFFARPVRDAADEPAARIVP